jgi:hypothetical protein
MIDWRLFALVLGGGIVGAAIGARKSAALGAPPNWWIPRAPRPRVCYPTKTKALIEFVDTNQDIIQNYGGIDYQVSPAEFDAVNHKLGLSPRRQVRSIAEALWAAMPSGRPYCLDQIDLDVLNDTSPAKEAQRSFELPDYVHERQMAKAEADHARRALQGAARRLES